MRKLRTIFAASLVLAAAVPATGQLLEQDAPAQDREKIPGHYTVGFYSDQRGSTEPLKIAKDATTFDMWLGVSGDSTRVFSGIAMSIELPYGVELGGPIVWIPRGDLVERGVLLDPGITVDFPHDCARQTGKAPVILARVPMKILAGLDEAVITPKRHRQFGLSVELCYDERAWPKPYADPVPLKVKRKLSLWDRITGMFD